MSSCCDKLMSSTIYVPKRTIETCLLLKALGSKFRLNCEKYENTMIEVYGKDKINFYNNSNETKDI
jgi:hypothetical protein